MKISLGKWHSHPMQGYGGFAKVIVTGHKKNADWEPDSPAICVLQHWAFDCCGAVSISSFSRELANWWDSKANTNMFVSWLKTVKLTDHWKPNEFLFLLSDGNQTTQNMRHLANHPLVRKLDSYLNKAHGPHQCELYRLSFAEDFKHHDLATLPKPKKSKVPAAAAA